jgi:hypothetical protein
MQNREKLRPKGSRKPIYLERRINIFFGKWEGIINIVFGI